MTFEHDVVVTEIKADFDPFGGEYTHISLGYRVPIPMPPQTGSTTLPPRPTPVMYKHAIHLIIPRESWTGQYTMWQEFHVTVKDDGQVQLTRKHTTE
jgi:sRNA-binding regulator protein Hfq